MRGKNIKRPELAKASGISLNTLKNWLDRDIFPQDALSIIRLADTLELDEVNTNCLLRAANIETTLAQEMENVHPDNKKYFRRWQPDHTLPLPKDAPQATGRAPDFSAFDPGQGDTISQHLECYLERPRLKQRIGEFLAAKKGGHLVITGVPGSGKSALAASVINSRAIRDKRSMAFHFITRTRRKHITAALLEQFNAKYDLNIFVPQAEMMEEDIARTYQYELAKLNRHLKAQGERLLVVIDALDELVDGAVNRVNLSLFQFIPVEVAYSQIDWLITSRPGVVYQTFLEYAALQPVQQCAVAEMDANEVRDLAILHGFAFDSATVQRLTRVSEGNPLYLYLLFTALRNDADFDLTSLPPSIPAFFHSELRHRFRIADNPLLRDVLAVLLVMQQPFTTAQLAEILQVKQRELRDNALMPIACYLRKTGQDTYALFHERFRDSLIVGDNPIIDADDLDAAHRRIICWCEPLEQKPQQSQVYEYAYRYLPAHLWEIGKRTNYAEFLGLLNRNNLYCAFACIEFLLSMIMKRSHKEILEDKILHSDLTNLFMLGGDVSRRTFLLFKYELSGYGYYDFNKFITNELIGKFRIGDKWFDEIYISGSHAMSGSRLEITLSRIPEVEKMEESIDKKRYLKRYYHSAAAMLSNPSDSKIKFDCSNSIFYYHKSHEITKSIKPEYLLPYCYNSIDYAEFIYNKAIGESLNNYAFGLRRCGRIKEAIDMYRESIIYYEKFSNYRSYIQRLNPKYETALPQHNLSHLIILNGLFSDGYCLISDAIMKRIESMEYVSIESSLRQLNNIFRDTELFVFYMFFELFRLKSKLYRNGLDKYTYYSDYIDCLLYTHETIKSGLILKKFWKIYDIKSYQDEYTVNLYHLRHSIATSDKIKAGVFIEYVNDIIRNYGIEKIIVVAGRNYLTLWETLARAHLLLGNPEQAHAILTEKLAPWFAEYDFKSLLPRYYALQSEYYRFIGDTQRAAEFQTMREERLKQGRAMIANKFLDAEIMDYLDNIVAQLDDPELTVLYQEVRERLATGFIPDFY